MTDYPIDRQLVLIGPKSAYEKALDGRETQLDLLSRLELMLPGMESAQVRGKFRKCISRQRAGQEQDYWDRFRSVGEMLADPSSRAEDDPVEMRVYGINSITPMQHLSGTILAQSGGQIVCQSNAAVGDRHSIAGSPAAGPAANRTDFDEQWAMGSQHGIDLPPDLTIDLPQVVGPDREVALNGSGIRVAVFDSSPFVNIPLAIPTTRNLTGLIDGGPPLWLTVRHAKGVKANYTPNVDEFADHGLCVASLVHKVAPWAQVELIRVLNDHVEGDAAILTREILDFVTRQVDARANRAPWHAVINLSLHVSLPAGDPVLHDLTYALCCAHANGILVLAAAGNETLAGANVGNPPLYPASECSVLGVAASSLNKERAWFSNAAALPARGRHGVMAPGCGVVALVNKGHPDSDGYIHVSGTSYATPLASGMAALSLQKQLLSLEEGSIVQEDTAQMLELADEARGHVRDEHSQRGGVINIADAF